MNVPTGTKKHRVVIKGAPGYRHPPLNLSSLGILEEDVALAVTIPSKNMVACIDVGYKTPGEARFPWEETFHYITILSTRNGMYSMVREGVKKAIDNDPSDTYQVLQKTVPLAEAIAEVREEYDIEYRNEMSRYREAVLDYFGTNDRGIFSRGTLDATVETEKELLRAAADNIVKLYEGPDSYRYRTSMLALTIYAASSFPEHKRFLESCATLDKKWDSIIGLKHFFSALPDDLQKTTLCFPMDHFHFFVAQTIEIVRGILEYYTSGEKKMALLSLALPPMLCAIDFTVDHYAYYEHVMHPETSPSRRLGLRCDLQPRIDTVVKDRVLVKNILQGYDKKFNCPLARSYTWVADPTQPIDTMKHSLVGRTGVTQMTSYYLNRSFNLLDLMTAVEEAFCRMPKCPHCQGLIENTERLGPDLADALRNRYISKNSPQLLLAFEQAASNISYLVLEYFKQLARRYATDLLV